MADRFPLILNTSNNQIQEIASGDNLDLTGSGISNAGIITAGNVTIGAATTDLIVTGDARITGILTIGTSSLKLDGPNNLVNVGTALTLGHTQGLQFHTQNLHSAGFEVNQINVSGITTIGGKLDTNGVIEAIAGENKIPFLYANMGALPNAGTYHGMFAHVHSEGKGYFAHAGAWYELVNKDTNGNVTLNKDLDVDGHTNLDNISVAGVSTFTGNSDFSAGIDVTGNATVSGNLSVGGVLTYEDVTNVDSVGLITARTGIRISANGDLRFANGTWTGEIPGKIQHNSNKLYIQSGTNGTQIRRSDGQSSWEWNSSGHFIPGIDSNVNIGENAKRVANIYADTLYGDGSNLIGIDTDLVSDTSPQLGGNLDGNGHNILLDDNNKLHIGNLTSSTGDLQLYHDGSASFIENSTGYLAIRNSSGNSNTVFIRGKGDEDGIRVIGNGAVELYHDNTRSIYTIQNGVSLQATTSRLLWPQNGDAQSRSWGFIGEDGVYGMFELKHSDTNDTVTDKKSARFYANDGVYLYYNDNLRFQTTNAGATITDSVKVNGASNGGQTVVISSGSTRGSTIGVTNTSVAGIFWSSNNDYAIYKTAGSWSGNYQQLKVKWQTGIELDGGTSYGLSGTRFRCHALPTDNNTYDLGTSSLRWRNIYTNDLNLSNKGKTNDVDNTWGDYTIQEGESDLFLINNRSGKKYKFNLTEVS